jgi:hypothetical protein
LLGDDAYESLWQIVETTWVQASRIVADTDHEDRSVRVRA